MTPQIVLALGAVLAVVRIYIGYAVAPAEASAVGAYEAIAHVFMGGLLVAAWNSAGSIATNWRWQLFWALCVLEVVVAVLSRTYDHIFSGHFPAGWG